MNSIFIADAQVFTGTGAVLARAHVLIEEKRIAAVGPNLTRPAGARVIDAGGQFLLAGFIDVHTHLALPAVPERPEPHPDVPFHAVRAAREKLASGVTTVRDVGGNNHADLALKRAILRGDTPGPRLFASGRAIVPTGGHIHYFCEEADGVDAVTRAVRRQVKAGADWVKLMISGGIANVEEHPDQMAYSRDEIRAAVETARELGRRVAVHAYPSRAIRIAAELGVATIEHAVELDDAALDTVKRHETFIVPTHAVYHRLAQNPDGKWPQLVPIAQRVYERKTPCLRRAIEEGVRIAVGTDCGRHFPHGEFSSELRSLAEAGMAPEAVLLAATRTNAELLGLTDALGSIEPGKLADLVLLGGDPLEDLAATADARLIVLDGHPIDPLTLRGTVPRSMGSPR